MKKFVVAALFAAVLPLAVSAATPAGNPVKKPVKKPAAAAAAKAQSPITKIEMLGDLNYTYKPGPGSQLATTYCLTCHSSAYVSMQPPLDKDRWTAEVAKMRNVYGATAISDADAEKIAEYLTKAYSPPPG